MDVQDMLLVLDFETGLKEVRKNFSCFTSEEVPVPVWGSLNILDESEESGTPIEVTYGDQVLTGPEALGLAVSKRYARVWGTLAYVREENSPEIEQVDEHTVNLQHYYTIYLQSIHFLTDEEVKATTLPG